MTLLLVFLGGAVGAPVRYLIDRLVQRWHESAFPWGTLTVNLLGSFMLGVMIMAMPDGAARSVLGLGFCGALTTFSTFGFETVRLLEEGSPRTAVFNAVGGVTLGVLAALAGKGLGALLL